MKQQMCFVLSIFAPVSTVALISVFVVFHASVHGPARIMFSGCLSVCACVCAWADGFLTGLPLTSRFFCVFYVMVLNKLLVLVSHQHLGCLPYY